MTNQDEAERVQYNKTVAADLCRELIETAKQIAKAIEAGAERGPLVDVTCERLGKAISLLKTQHLT
jgi:hypothetical protein